MTENTHTDLWKDDDAVFFDFLAAREAALQAAVGSFLVANIPTAHIRAIAAGTSSEIIAFAARIALYQRGEDWQV